MVKPKILRTPKMRSGELKVYFGRESRGADPDVIFSWCGTPDMRRDSAFLHHTLASPRPRMADGKFENGPSFIEELEKRGYDITTIKFSIMKKQTKEV